LVSHSGRTLSIVCHHELSSELWHGAVDPKFCNLRGVGVNLSPYLSLLGIGIFVGLLGVQA
jgi:hypothetical protein